MKRFKMQAIISTHAHISFELMSALSNPYLIMSRKKDI